MRNVCTCFCGGVSSCCRGREDKKQRPARCAGRVAGFCTQSPLTKRNEMGRPAVKLSMAFSIAVSSCFRALSLTIQTLVLISTRARSLSRTEIRSAGKITKMQSLGKIGLPCVTTTSVSASCRFTRSLADIMGSRHTFKTNDLLSMTFSL